MAKAIAIVLYYIHLFSCQGYVEGAPHPAAATHEPDPFPATPPLCGTMGIEL